MKNNLTEREAAEKWVNEFNAIESSLLEVIMKHDFDLLKEITPLTIGDYVYTHLAYVDGEIEDIDYSNEQVVIEGNIFSFEDVYREDQNTLPMWGTLWTFGSQFDEDWARGNLEVMAGCGFRIYEIDEGIIFGIDGAGYSFYDEHWIPLYKARGLQWHETEGTEVA